MILTKEPAKRLAVFCWLWYPVGSKRMIETNGGKTGKPHF
jgi:hypothetical protein